MTIGLYTSEHYFDLKKAAVEEAVKKIGVGENFSLQSSFRPSLPTQTFGFEEMFRRARSCAEEALTLKGADIGIGIENSLTFIYNTNEWFYVIGIAMQTQDGRHAESFAPGIMVPPWMMDEVQKSNIKIDSLTNSLAGEDDPVMFFSGGMLTRKDIMVPALLLAFSNLNLKKGPASPMPVPQAPQQP